MRRPLLGLSVFLTMVSATALLAALAGWVSSPFLVALQAATPATIASACVAVLAAIPARSRRALTASMLILGLWVSLVLDTKLSATPPSLDGPSVRVIAANLMLNNPTSHLAAAEVLADDPDVLVSVETSQAAEKVIAASGLRLVATGAGRADRVMIWSRHRALGGPLLDLGDRSLPTATVISPAGTFTVVGVHLMSPTTESTLLRWSRNWELLPQELHTLGSPLVVMGDFNTSLMHRHLRNELRHFDHAAASSMTSLLSPTWPAQPYRWWAQPLQVLDLDHILLSGFAAGNPDRSPITGSDHLAVSVEIAVLGD